MTLRFPTLFDALPPAPAPATVPAWRIRRVIAVLAGLVVALGALAGCDAPAAHAFLDEEADAVRTEAAAPTATVRPVSVAATPATVHETVNPASGTLRLPTALQSYGL